MNEKMIDVRQKVQYRIDYGKRLLFGCVLPKFCDLTGKAELNETNSKNQIIRIVRAST